MEDKHGIREFLASRRARITPEQAGLPVYGTNRRVSGLRREEVAMLAGISVEYYTRLERGNTNGVSDEGIIFANGSRFGGHALLIKDGQIMYVYNFLGIPPENRIVAPAPASGKHIIGVEFTKERMGQYRDGVGPLKLYIDDQLLAEEEIRTVMGHFSLCGEGLCIGYDSGDAVSSSYAGSKFEFTGGTINKVVFDIADDAYIDVEAHLAAAMARD